MNTKSAEIFRGLLAIILLIIYFVTLGYVILETMKWDPSDPPLIISSNILWTINIIGGLVAAVIIANLAVSKPGEAPLSQLENMSEAYGRNFMVAVIWIYVIIWLIVGLAAFLTGVIFRPEACEPLNELGKTWLGILLGSAYAWFGINRS
ncbi:MAG: hypothetical protein ABFS28_09105 [Bacteroidota bacterium]